MKQILVLAPCILLAVIVSGCTQPTIGGETDEHGCIIPAGYSWCESSQKCLRTWEEPCPGNETLPEGQCCTKQGTNLSMCFPEAVEIAENSACVENGTLTENHFCNEYTGTWWIDLDMEKEGCSPACVVDVETGQAEINWRCTGLLPE